MTRARRGKLGIAPASNWLAACALAWSTVACGPPPAHRAALEMEHIGTVPDVPRTTEDDDGSDVTTPNSGTPNPLKQNACAQGNFDALDEVLRACEAPLPSSSELPGDLRHKLDIHVRVRGGTPTVARGAKVELSVTLKNTSAEPVTLYFTGDPAPSFDTETFDARGRRVDPPPGKPPAWPKGAGPTGSETAARVTLEPGASGTVAIPWRAVKGRWAPELAKSWTGSGYPRASAGPLPKGKYTLRIVLPIVGAFDKGGLEVPKLTVTVT